jgi:hypothetical protein
MLQLQSALNAIHFYLMPFVFSININNKLLSQFSSSCSTGSYADTTTVPICRICMNFCLLCTSGYNCRSCRTGCSICSNTTDCIICNAGLYKVTDSTGVVSCLDTCPTKYYSDGNNVCYSCMIGCDICSLNVSSIQVCNKCSVGYFLKYNICIELKCDPNCGDCFLTTDNLICYRCKTGYFVKLDEYQCILVLYDIIPILLISYICIYYIPLDPSLKHTYHRVNQCICGKRRCPPYILRCSCSSWV